jgi:hypothetical protein
MARVELNEYVRDRSGRPFSGASVAVTDRATGATSTIYQAETGISTRANPLTTDAGGRMSYTAARAWLEEGSYTLTVTAGALSYVQYFEAVNGVSPGGRELGYAELTSNFNVAADTFGTTPQDITGLAVTVTVGTRPIEIVAAGTFLTKTNSGGTVNLLIAEGATVLAFTTFKAASTDQQVPALCRVRLGGAKQPSAGSHTYKAQLQNGDGTAGSTAQLGASANGPAALSVVER